MSYIQPKKLPWNTRKIDTHKNAAASAQTNPIIENIRKVLAVPPSVLPYQHQQTLVKHKT